MPQDLIDLPRIGVVNWHRALLPNYRGRGDWALQWMLRNDEPEFGFSFHWVDADWDTGPMLMQQAIAISDDDDATALLTRVVHATIDVLPGVIEMAARGEPGTPQVRGF